MRVKFVNRSKEIDFLFRQKSQLGKKNKVVLICGDSGVGKSELTEHFLSQGSSLAPSVKVRIQQAENDTYEAGYFFTKTARAFHERSEKDPRIKSLPQFLQETTFSGIVANKLWKSIQTDLLDVVPFKETLKTTADLVLQKGDFHLGEFFQSTDSETLYTLYEYVRSECKRTSFIVNVESIQSLDERSFNWFLSTIKESNNCLFIFEYTDNDERGYTFFDITSKLEKEGIDFTAFPLKPLNLDEVRKILDEEPRISWELLQKSYVNWNGNMRLLIDVLARVKYGLPTPFAVSIDINTATIDHLRSLSKGEIFLLIILYAHNEPVQKSLLNRIVIFKDALQYILDVKSDLLELERRSLVKISQDEISIAHDSIINNISQINGYDLFVLLAQKFWLSTYEDLLDSNDVYSSRGWRLMKVLYFVSLLNYDSKIYGLLNQISDEALRSRDPEKMILYVQEVRNGIFQKTGFYSERLLQIDYWMVELLYKIGNSSEAWAIFSDINDLSAKNDVLRAILLEQVGLHRNAIDFCNEKLSGCNLRAKYELTLRLVRLVTNYDIGNKEQTQKEFKYLYGNSKFVNLFEYGFVLRNAELVFSFRESLSYYQKSIEHFKKYGAIRQAAFSRITYGVHLGLTGQLEKAKEQFDLATKELDSVISERHTLLNNYATLLLYQRVTSSETEELLRQAMLSAASDFERITIFISYLVLMDWRGNDVEAEKAIESIMDILKKPSFASKEIIRYAYFDIYKYYEKRDAKKARIFKSKINELGLPETAIWKFWLYNETMPDDDEEIFSSTIDRAISFLCNWNMEYDSQLMQYE